MSTSHNSQAILELVALFEEAAKTDFWVSFVIADKLVKLGYMPSNVLAWLFLFSQIDKAKRGENSARKWLTTAIQAKIADLHALSAYALHLCQERRKPRYNPFAERDRQIAWTIYQARKVTRLITRPYTDSAQLDEIERLDNRGLHAFFEESDITDWCALEAGEMPKRLISRRSYEDNAPGKLDESNYRKIYRRHRRALIIADFAMLALLRHYSATATDTAETPHFSAPLS
jgi:hypothetical protein